ncbi:LysR family transcriptional regulator [Faecalibacillus intestinalis]|uniref:LysR family transcriptional regulator n=1 Tax=Faecalibacillus intestinalis TaxID=1982626 RepID=UPI00295E3975|nr:LysR family transcriptional regulator [Faecalibacillus intestinalis]
MELRILQYFLMVAREENITRAAKQLHMTQPTLSRQLMQLEDELGKPLFIRGKRKIELTDEGVLLRRRAEEILSLVNKTEQEITQSEEEMVGQIMIGTGIFSSSQAVLSQVIEEFHDEYPLVKFDIYVGNADLIKERVNQGLVDIGILLEPVDISKYNHLRIPLQEKWGIIVSKTNFLAHKPYVKKEDLKELPLFLTNREIVQSEISNWLKGDVLLHSMFSYNFASAILPFIQDDQGAAITVEGAYQVLNQKNICFIPFYPELSTNTVFIWKKYTRLSPVIDRFIKKVQEYLEKSRSLYEK